MKNKYTFNHSDGEVDINTTMHDAVDCGEIVRSFADFMTGCGFAQLSVARSMDEVGHEMDYSARQDEHCKTPNGIK